MLPVFPNFNFYDSVKRQGAERLQKTLSSLPSQVSGTLWLPFHHPSFSYMNAVLINPTKRHKSTSTARSSATQGKLEEMVCS